MRKQNKTLAQKHQMPVLRLFLYVNCINAQKIVSELDDFDSDIVRRTVYEFHGQGKYQTAQSILNVINKKKLNWVHSSMQAKAPLKF